MEEILVKYRWLFLIIGFFTMGLFIGFILIILSIIGFVLNKDQSSKNIPEHQLDNEIFPSSEQHKLDTENDKELEKLGIDSKRLLNLSEEEFKKEILKEAKKIVKEEIKIKPVIKSKLNNEEQIKFDKENKKKEKINEKNMEVIYLKYWKNEYDELITKNWNKWGSDAFYEFKCKWPSFLGKKNYSEYSKELSIAVPNKRQSYYDTYFFKYMTKRFKSHNPHIDLRKKRKNIVKCSLCNDKFNSFDSETMFFLFDFQKVKVCPKCCRICLYESPNVKKEELSEKLRNVYVSLDEQIPPIQFKRPSVIKNHLTAKNHVKVLKALKETPDCDIYKQTFGSYFKALIEAKLLDNNSRQTARGTHCLAKDGHECLSISEKTIDDWMYNNNIKHSKEPMYPKDADMNPNGFFRGDWLVNDSIIVEYFGLKGNKDYDDKIILKKRLAKKHRIKLIEIYHNDLKRLDKIFSEVKKI